jgi:hypothetical protein
MERICGQILQREKKHPGRVSKQGVGARYHVISDAIT